MAREHVPKRMNDAQKEELERTVKGLGEGAVRGTAAALRRHPALAAVRGMLVRMGPMGKAVLEMAENLETGKHNSGSADAPEPHDDGWRPPPQR